MDFTISIFGFANTTLLLTLLAKPAAKQGPPTAEILIFFDPFFAEFCPAVIPNCPE